MLHVICYSVNGVTESVMLKRRTLLLVYFFLQFWQFVFHVFGESLIGTYMFIIIVSS